MMHGNGFDFVLPRMQRIEKADVAVAAQAEDIRDFLANQVIGDDGCAIVGGGVVGGGHRLFLCG